MNAIGERSDAIPSNSYGASRDAGATSFETRLYEALLRMRSGVELRGVSRPTRGSQPRHQFFRPALIRVDGSLLLHRQPDVVEAVEQAVLAVRIDLELDRAAVG